MLNPWKLSIQFKVFICLIKSPQRTDKCSKKYAIPIFLSCVFFFTKAQVQKQETVNDCDVISGFSLRTAPGWV